MGKSRRREAHVIERLLRDLGNIHRSESCKTVHLI